MVNDDLGYFKSHKDKLMFLLLEVEGAKRNDLLGITRVMYQDKDAAQRWYNSIAEHISPANNPGDVKAINAISKLDELYAILTM